MTNQPDKRLLALCAPVTATVSLLVMLVGIVVIMGWEIRSNSLTSFIQGQPPMKANAALGFFMGGFALWCLRKKRPTAAPGTTTAPGIAKREILGKAVAALVVALGVITLLELIFDKNLGIDELIARDVFTLPGFTPGRMAATTALNFVAIGSALLLLDLKWAWPVEFLVLTAAPIALTAVIGYFFNARGFSGLVTFNHMSPHSSATFLVWCVGVLCARPDRGIVLLATLENPGSTLARRLMPLAVIIPLIIGWYSLRGLWAGHYSPEFAIAVYTLLVILIFTILIRLTARSLFRADAGRQQTERALSESEERFRAQFQNSPIPTYTWHWTGTEFVLKGYNDAALGATKGRIVDFIGTTTGKMYPDLPEIEQDMRRCMVERMPVHREMVYRFRSNRDQRHLSVTYGFIPPGLILVHATDVTEQREAEAAVRQAEKKYRAIFENASEGIFQTSPDGRYLAVNPAMARILGYESPEKLIQERTDIGRQSYVSPGRREDFKRIIAEQGGVTGFECEVYRKDGSTVWVSESARSVHGPDGTVLYFEGIMEDITERRKAVEQIRFQAHLLDTVAQAVIATDLQGRITYWNRFAETLYGWPASEVIGRNVLGITVTAEIQTQAELVMAKLRSGESWSGEFLVRRRDGSTFTAAVFNAPVRNRESELVGIIGISSDVTLQKRLEEQLRQSQKLEAIGQLAGGIAHDFNNLLTVIQGNLDLVLMKPGEIPPESRQSIQEIAEAAKKAGNLTRQLLTFSRKQLVELRPLNLNLVIDDMMKMLRRLIGENIQLTLQLAPELPMIRADLGMIEQILLNLAVNSRDAMPQGGRLIIGTQKRSIDADYVRIRPDVAPGQYVCLTVTDTGCGIPPENLPHIFEPFFTTKAVGKGTGLGLATVFGVVKQHKGWVQVYSKPGNGTGFQIFLPATGDSPAQRSEANRDLSAIRGSEIILVVEDEFALREMVRTALKQFGYQVLDATSGISALEVWGRHKHEISLVFTDMLMPGGLSGLDLGHRLRAENPRLKVIYTSGYAAGLFGEDAVLEEGTNFLQKPYNPLTLARTIRELLDQTNG